MLKLSIFTPSHDTRFLNGIYEELIKETYESWEWVILLNGNAEFEKPQDGRVKVFRYEGDSSLIGELKYVCCGYATGDVLIELDHDDIPVVGFMAKIADVFEDNDVDFVYTNTANFIDGTNEPQVYSSLFGWETRDFHYNGVLYKETLSPPFEPPYLLDITHAPNHFRCWRKSFYDRIGGHDKTLSVGDDYELLLRTFLQAKKTIHIAECFYLYRVFPNGGNTFSIRQNELRNVINIFYFKEYVNVAVKHAKNNNWKCLDLGSGPCKENGFLGIDMFPSENVDIVADLSQKWPFEDGSVGVIRAHDFIEHIHDPVFFFDEAYRVLAPNGLLMIKVPSANCLAAYRDPTHVSFYNSDTFRFFYEDGVAAKFKDRIHCGFTRFKIFETEQCGVTYIHCHLFSNKFNKYDKWKPMFPGMIMYNE